MRSHSWLFVTLLSLLAFAQPLPAQKALRNIKTYLKQNKASDALNEINKLAADTTSEVRFMPKLYHYGVEANIMLNNAENEKIYLKQAYDTAKFFTSTYDILHFILRCEVQEQRELALKGKKLHYHNDHRQLAHSYYNNLGAAAIFYYRKKLYPEAMKYLQLSLELPTLPIWGEDKSVTETPAYRQHAFLYQTCAYRCQQYAEVAQYSAITLADSTRRRRSLEFLSQAAKAQGDTAAYLRYVETGLREYPDHLYFFTQLAGYYSARQEYQQVLALSDSMLRHDSMNVSFIEAKAMAHINLKQFDEAIAASRAALGLDSANVEVKYYIGLSYCSLAANVVLPTNINSASYRRASAEQKAYYKAARPFLEEYREKEPEKVSRWAPLLYRVYYALNEGQKFEEISEIMKRLF